MRNLDDAILSLSTVEDILEIDPSGIFLGEISEKFILSAKQLFEEIELEFASGRPDRCLAHLHQLKGIAGVAAAAGLPAICDSVRSLDGQLLLTSGPVICAQLREALNDYQREIERLLASLQ